MEKPGMLRYLPPSVWAGAKTRFKAIRSLWTMDASTFDPYKYTSGRWLRLDKEQIHARHIRFDFEKLCARAVACSPGAHAIVTCVKVEGGFNRAFLLGLDNGMSVVARVPYPTAGPARLVTNSEVATMEYVRKHTSVPVPAVLDWSDNPDNSICAEYIIMEHATGVQLHHRWPSMNSHQHMLSVKALADMTKEMSRLQFPGYGSIYFADAPVDKCNLIPMSDRFCVGPHCGNRYWPLTVGDDRFYERRAPNRGPWKTHEDYCRGLLDVGLSRIPLSNPPERLGFQGTVEEHLQLAGVTEQVILRLTQSDAIRNVERPMLIHRDLHKRNIFVSEDDPTKITSLIDWQSSSIEPVHLYADETPDLCEFPEMWNEAEVGDQPTESQRKTIDDVSICRQTWEVMIKGYMQDLHRARAMDQDFLRLLRYTPSAWKHGATPFREDMMQLSARWSNPLSLSGSCPYQPTVDELAKQKILWEEFQTAQAIKQEVVASLHTDEEGWIPIDRWNDVRQAYRSLFDEWLEAVVKTGVITEEKARQMWPFDVD